MTGEDLDAAILAAVGPQWTKIAVVVAQVAPNDAVGQAAAVDRLKALVAARRIQSRGNLDRWRLSDVRLPPTFGLPVT